jgi:membrane-associated phospholipid phosphatase
VGRRTGTVCILLAGLALTYVIAFRADAVATLDLEAITDPRTGEFRSVATIMRSLSIALLGSAASLGLLALAVLVQAHRAGGAHVVVRTSAMVAGCFLTGEIAKWILGEVRPLAELTQHGAAASFPSVHSAVAMVLAVGLARLADRRLVPFACLYAAAMGAFTVLAGWHFPSDVVGGLLLGAAWSLGIAGPRRPPGIDPAAAAAAVLAALLAAGLLLGYARSFGRAGVAGAAFATGAAAIAAATVAAAALCARTGAAGKPRPSSGVGARRRR